jgi:hypothetical protein
MTRCDNPARVTRNCSPVEAKNLYCTPRPAFSRMTERSGRNIPHSWVITAHALLVRRCSRKLGTHTPRSLNLALSRGSADRVGDAVRLCPRTGRPATRRLRDVGVASRTKRAPHPTTTTVTRTKITRATAIAQSVQWIVAFGSGAVGSGMIGVGGTGSGPVGSRGLGAIGSCSSGSGSDTVSLP